MSITITGQGTLATNSGTAKYGNNNLTVIKYGNEAVWNALSTKKYTFTAKSGDNLGTTTLTTNSVSIDSDFRSASSIKVEWTVTQTANSGTQYVNNDANNYQIQIGLGGTYTNVASSPLSGWSTGNNVKDQAASGSKTLTGDYNFSTATLRFKKNISQPLSVKISGSITITRKF